MRSILKLRGGYPYFFLKYVVFTAYLESVKITVIYKKISRISAIRLKLVSIRFLLFTAAGVGGTRTAHKRLPKKRALPFCYYH